MMATPRKKKTFFAVNLASPSGSKESDQRPRLLARVALSFTAKNTLGVPFGAAQPTTPSRIHATDSTIAPLENSDVSLTNISWLLDTDKGAI